jgi:preprotein translocase subunit SecE
MATKTAIANHDEGSFKRPKFLDGPVGVWNEFTGFLGDVRAEMRKVVAPSRKEVRATTSVVIVTVFIFGVFFFIVDAIFRIGMNGLLNKLTGTQ